MVVTFGSSSGLITTNDETSVTKLFSSDNSFAFSLSLSVSSSVSAVSSFLRICLICWKANSLCRKFWVGDLGYSLGCRQTAEVAGRMRDLSGRADEDLRQISNLRWYSSRFTNTKNV